MWNRVKEGVLDAYSKIRWDNASNPYSISNDLSPNPPTTRDVGMISRGKFLFT